ncbi:TspO/MBR family protein [Piscinibacter sakaiensis]|uniref:Tryptophan-rich sensory protein n=1 Tax=Piscinibacter sakaiensis TaxID=1547922 RepID=A0A0K8NVH3_PISS1|nr:TspO/MBR family protein [Piscinibacter sakaiensis]GAP34396.1 tryptophan-rich sensory protein [Piscinibacter sakaiensis]
MSRPLPPASSGTRRRAIAWAALAALGVALLGALSTDLGDWYAGLRQPAWKPPDAWFGPAWTAIYATTALAVLQAWGAAPTRARRDGVLAAAGINAVLNIVWSLAFFRLRRPDWALAEGLGLWLSIVLLAVVCGRERRSALWWVLPYLAWVTFALALNAAVVRLNGPF